MSGTVQFERLSECIVVAHGYEVDHLVEVFLDNLRRLYTSGLATYDNSHPLHYRRTLRPPPRFSRQARSTNGTRVILSIIDLVLYMNVRMVLICERGWQLFIPSRPRLGKSVPKWQSECFCHGGSHIGSSAAMCTQ